MLEQSVHFAYGYNAPIRCLEASREDWASPAFVNDTQNILGNTISILWMRNNFTWKIQHENAGEMFPVY